MPYPQDAEPVGTPIPIGNYNQSPIQLVTFNGRDDTVRREIIVLQVWCLSGNDTAAHAVMVSLLH